MNENKISNYNFTQNQCRSFRNENEESFLITNFNPKISLQLRTPRHCYLNFMNFSICFQKGFKFQNHRKEKYEKVL